MTQIINLSVRATTLKGKFFPVREVGMSLFKPERERTSNGRSDSHKSDLEINYGFWNSKFNFDGCQT